MNYASVLCRASATAIQEVVASISIGAQVIGTCNELANYVSL